MANKNGNGIISNEEEDFYENGVNTPPANRILSSEDDFTEGLETNEESYLDVKQR